MGISARVAKFLLKKSFQADFRGRLLTLGRQEIFLKHGDLAALWGKVSSSENQAGAVEPEDFFKLLGFSECDSLDYVAYSGATIIQDLNEPISAGLYGKFDFILDGGTLEHCYNVAEYMASITRMLRVGGWVLHVSPSLNRTNHGFYQFQPTFYFSFYGANAFERMKCFFLEMSPGYDDYDLSAPCKVVPVENFNNLDFRSSEPCEIVFVARKAKDLSAVKQPIQEFYFRIQKEKERNDGGRIDDATYRKIVGEDPDNVYENIMAKSYWL